MNAKEFFEWERTSRDTIDVKRCYIDIAGDLVSGLLLSQIIYWFIPGEKGSKLRVHKQDRLWLAKGRLEWWDECRISPKQFDRAIKILQNKNLVEIRRFRFRGSPTIHVWLNVGTLVESVNSILTKGEVTDKQKGDLLTNPSVDLEVAKKVKSLTETPTKNTSETTIKSNSNNVFTMYEENIGQLTPVVVEELKTLEEEYQSENVCQAVVIATKAQKRNLNYIRGILKRQEVTKRESRFDKDLFCSKVYKEKRRSLGADPPVEYLSALRLRADRYMEEGLTTKEALEREAKND